MASRDGLSLGAIAEKLGLTVDGDPGRTVSGVAPLESAGPEHISFLTDLRYRERARVSRAGAFLTPLDVTGLPAPTLRSEKPQHALIDLVLLFHPPVRHAPGVHPSAIVAADARVHDTASIGALTVVEAGAVIGAGVRLHPLVYIGPDVDVGDDSEIHAHVVVREGARIGRRAIIHGGAVIGSDGFGYASGADGHRKIPQVGTVVLEDDVEIGANTTIDRGTLGTTIVRRGTKIDNLVQVGHNVEIGEHVILVAQVGISGSSRIGHGAVLAGQVGVADHVAIGDGAMIGAQSGIHADIAAGDKVLGSPARSLTLAKRILLSEGHLPELVRRVRELERRLAALEGGRADGPSHG
ncbi:MAG: UDP-3-O-(3-hydroxymyristoyl)glucosamine N-acyltransferase [Candidatus Rokuibacteriota bacterium]|nr:MAG: UDP-3-O-(3-hydroxymyristoyl)glucosamine N-acyltransferase [Candidatus Rokubacteria bacterium]